MSESLKNCWQQCTVPIGILWLKYMQFKVVKLASFREWGIFFLLSYKFLHQLIKSSHIFFMFENFVFIQPNRQNKTRHFMIPLNHEYVNSLHFVHILSV